jgi:hypothetical protein
VPSSLLDQPEVLVAGRQIWHAFDELVAPLATSAPAIQHPVWQVPPLHTCPEPQVVPLALTVQEVVELLVRQIWQAFDGLVAPFP